MEVLAPCRKSVARLLIVVGLLVLAGTAWAQTGTVVIYAEGPDAEAARRAVIDGLPAGTSVADDQAFHKELARQGQKKPFGRHVDSRAIERVRRAAAAVGASTVFLVRVRKFQPRAALLLVVESSGSVGPDKEIQLRVGLKDEDRDELRRAVDKQATAPPAPTGPVENVHPAASSEPKNEAPTAPAASPPAPPPPSVAPAESVVTAARESPEMPAAAAARRRPMDAHAVSTTFADIEVGGGVAGRRFDYRNGIAPYAYTVRKPAMPAGAIAAELYPLAGTGSVWGDIGFVAEYSVLFSSSWDGTNPTAYGAGMRARIHPGPDSPVLLRITVGYEFNRFGPEDAAEYRVPDVTYRAVRTGVDARIPLGHFSILAGTALRAVIDPNDISQQFYGPHGVGFDAQAGGTVMFLPHLEARLVGSYTRYSFSFGPPRGDNFGPGSAIDQLFGALLAIAYVN